MAPRNTRPNQTGPCKTCPQKQAMPPALRVAIQSLPEQQGQYLWSHVVFGTGTCISMIEGYAKHGMPGANANAIHALRDRLNGVLDALKGHHG